MPLTILPLDVISPSHVPSPPKDVDIPSSGAVPLTQPMTLTWLCLP